MIAAVLAIVLALAGGLALNAVCAAALEPGVSPFWDKVAAYLGLTDDAS